MLTLEEIKALEYCVGCVTPIGVPQARMLILAADALKREREGLEKQKDAKAEADLTETEKKASQKKIAELFEHLRREKDKQKELAPDVDPWKQTPMPQYPHYPNPHVIYCRLGSESDFPRTG